MWAFPIKFALAVFIVAGVLASAPPVQAVTLSELLVDLVQNQRQIKAAESDVEAAEERQGQVGATLRSQSQDDDPSRPPALPGVDPLDAPA